MLHVLGYKEQLSLFPTISGFGHTAVSVILVSCCSAVTITEYINVIYISIFSRMKLLIYFAETHMKAV